MTGRTGLAAMILCAAVAAAVSQDTAPGTVQPAKTDPDVVMDFGVVGLVKGQTARLSIVQVDPPEPDLPPGPCRVMLSFFIPNGSRQDSKPIDLRPGVAEFFDYPATDFTLLRGKATIIGPEKKFPPGPCRVGLEIIDNETQQTKLFVSPAEIRGFNPQPDPPGKEGRVPPGADKGFNPQPDPPGFPMIGLTRGQALRINVANVAVPVPGELPPGPCRATVSFFGADGGLIQKGKEILVEAGKSDFVTLEGGERRVQVRAHVVYTPPDGTRSAFPPDPCKPVATLELVDVRTGQSSLIVSPATIRGFNPQPDPPGTPPIIIGPEANR